MTPTLELEEGAPTVEERLVAAYSRLQLLQSLLGLRSSRDSLIMYGLLSCVEPTLKDLEAIEAALDRTVWGRASLATRAPDVPGRPQR
ncbi:MAG: hypothetical protein ACRD2X_11205 [Vicinamibacteraceae bacterium]